MSNPWNPIAIVWLGVLFTPMWTGVMAAINGKRLGSSRPVWLPLLIGFGSLAVSFGFELVVGDYLLVDVAIYFVALIVLWRTVLLHQCELYGSWQKAPGNSGAGWLWPVVSGIPLAIVVFLSFIVAPLQPLEPREVCERFCRAKSQEEMKKHTTLNLLPALPTWARRSHDTKFELLGEDPDIANGRGYFVDFRTASPRSSELAALRRGK